MSFSVYPAGAAAAGADGAGAATSACIAGVDGAGAATSACGADADGAGAAAVVCVAVGEAGAAFPTVDDVAADLNLDAMPSAFSLVHSMAAVIAPRAVN